MSDRSERSELNIIIKPESENVPTNLPRNSSLPPEEPVIPVSLKDLTEFVPPTLSTLSTLPPSLFTYKTMDTILTGNYSKNECNDSMICDIIAMYLKGQKILYIEAKTLCEQRLSYLMLPTICITAICSVISIALKEYQYGALIVSSLNALNFFFLNLINYLKLDAKAEAHRVSAYKFDRIQSKLEFNSGKILFIKGASKELEKLINETQNDVREIKETNQFVLPEDIRHNYPRLNTINVFSEVKKIQFEEIMLVNQLKDIMNQIINVKLQMETKQTIILKDTLQKLEQERQYITEMYITINNKYLDIDNQFEEEMEIQRDRMINRWQLCSFLKS
jgi:hypothetical protein